MPESSSGPSMVSTRSPWPPEQVEALGVEDARARAEVDDVGEADVNPDVARDRAEHVEPRGREEQLEDPIGQIANSSEQITAPGSVVVKRRVGRRAHQPDLGLDPVSPQIANHPVGEAALDRDNQLGAIFVGEPIAARDSAERQAKQQVLEADRRLVGVGLGEVVAVDHHVGALWQRGDLGGVVAVRRALVAILDEVFGRPGVGRAADEVSAASGAVHRVARRRGHPEQHLAALERGPGSGDLHARQQLVEARLGRVEAEPRNHPLQGSERPKERSGPAPPRGGRGRFPGVMNRDCPRATCSSTQTR